MPRKKKSRKVGQIGTPKITSNVRKPKEQRVRKHKGKPAGNRNSEAVISSNSTNTKVQKDPRHGSKKPIDLFADSTKPKKSSTTNKVKHFSPAKELEAIEKDTVLTSLLEKAELGKKLTKEEQNFVDKTLARHKVLCGLLGLSEDDDEIEEDNDILDELDSISIDDYRD